MASRLWLEEELDDDLKWSYRVERVLGCAKSQFQEIDLVQTFSFGKVLLLDGKMQSTEADEVFYHELLVHPALLHHPNPRTVFIMGGGEGATAREVLRHRSVEKVVMVDIDKVVTDFCSQHLDRNKAAFEDDRLLLINDDARTQLEAWPHKFDVIIGDLADPLDGGPCFQLYTQEFYKNVVSQKLNPGGLFVTQSGPAGFLSAREVFTTIHNTIASVFPKTLPFAQHFPSFCDCWGFNLAFKDAHASVLSPAEFDKAVKLRIQGTLEHLDGDTFLGITLLNKSVRKALREETEIYTVDNARFIHGCGHSGNQGSSAATPALPAPCKPVENGHAANGVNGHAVNGHAVNGHTVNGHAVNGHAVNGHAVNGHAVNGYAVNGHAVNGHAVNGHVVHANGHADKCTMKAPSVLAAGCT